MHIIVKKLREKQNNDRRKLKLYSIMDGIVSFLIIGTNLSSIITAIIALVHLSVILSEDKAANTSISFIFLVTFVVLLIASFILTLSLSIYRYNSNKEEYEKILNTLNYIKQKYEARKLSDEEFAKIIDVLWEKATTKRKIVIKKVLSNELKTSNQNKVGK
ncbi:hypothetical protein [Mycoplasma procyoni]|uniref:hypothetical protein n=1 Tax=Mycoplasma procyoni TaxID=568784 RepID=UPI00197C577B|nr:hypothetical protein [Mycoplasma procyoni]MBN3534677.1 hypothetical protein [Mycoplasma procyoni]